MDEDRTGETKQRTIIETIEVTGTQMIEQIKHLIKEGNVRQLRLTAKDSDFSLEMPMTVGVLVGGAVALTVPWLAILGVIAGLVTKVSIEIERDAMETDAQADKAEAPKSDAA